MTHSPSHKDVDDGKLQQARNHGGVEFGVFLRGDAQNAVGKLRQWGIVAGQGDHCRAVFFGDADGV